MDQLPACKSVIKELLAFSFLFNSADILLVDLKVHGNGGGLDGDTTLLFVFSSIGKSHVPGFRVGDDTGFRDQRVRQSGLSVID